MGVGNVSHALAALPLGKRLGTHCTGSWVGPRADLERRGKTRPSGIQSLNCPACSKSLNCLHYPTPLFLRGYITCLAFGCNGQAGN